MAFLSRLRSRHEKTRPDTEADEVRHLGAGDQDRLRKIALTSTDVSARRAACRKLTDPETLASLLGDADEGVREDAVRAILEVACGSGPSASAAAAAVRDTRHLIVLARTAALPEIRQGALDRLESPHALATLAKTAPIAAIRSAAVARVKDPQLLLAIALKGEHKDTAVAAMEALEDVDLVRLVAQSETSKAARRARARLEPARERPAEPPIDAAAPPTVDPPTEEPGPEEPAALSAESSPVPDAPEEPPAEESAVDSPEAKGPAESAEAVVSEGESHEEPATPADVEARRTRVASAEAFCVRGDAEAKNPDLTLRQADALLREGRVQGAIPDLPPRLVRRLRATRAALFARAQELREAEEWGRWANGALQEELCRRMEALVDREDYVKVAEELRQIDGAWQRAKRAPPGQADVLRKSYQDAHAKVKAHVDADLARRKAEEQANRAAKEALCVEAEGLSSSTDWLKTAEALKGLQARWKTVGPSPRHDSDRLWARFRAACDVFFKRRDEDRGRRKEEWGTNLTQKEALCTQAEALEQSSDWDAAVIEVRKLQAAWKNVGPVRRSQSDKVWQRFRKACDAFFERYKHRDELKVQALRDAREEKVKALETMVSEGTPLPEGFAKELPALQVKAEQPPLPDRAEDEKLRRRFVEARDKLIEAHPESFRGSDFDPNANRTKREKLCAKVEALADEAAAFGRESQPSSAHELARRLKEALAARTIGGAEGTSARRRALQEEASSARQTWNRLGPVPGEVGRALGVRFEEAVARLGRAIAAAGS